MSIIPMYLIDSGNLFICGFHHFGRLSGPFSMKNDILVPFGSQNRGFMSQDTYEFSIVPCQLYQCILIDSGNSFIYGFHYVYRVFEKLFLKNTI